MKSIIIGTAGHIDHGKTSLIKALTGRETDHLKEEMKRGITIELGFTFFDLPNGEKAGIIDVPGHEKFIKNMLAGIGGIDIVLMVIAANEGVMPQTREHLDILSILHIQHGLVVLTKKDIVDDEWLQMVEEEVKEEIRGTFLENAPLIPVSSVHGEGIETLKEAIIKMTQDIRVKSNNTPFRLPIDRLFTIDGFGTVVTGTQTEGSLKSGDEVMVYPTGQSAKIRNIQVYGEKAQGSFAGQRVALNLANIKKDEIQRGYVLAEKDSMEETSMLDVRLDLLKNTDRELKNNTRVSLYHGTSQVLCRVMILNKELIKAGESCYAQVRLEEKIAAKKGDYFVIRFYSPVETIGGGIVLDANPKKHKPYDKVAIEELKLLETGSEKDILEIFIKKYSLTFKPLSSIVKQLGKEGTQAEKCIEQLVKEKKVIMITKDLAFHHTILRALETNLETILKEYHEENSLRLGMSLEECRNRLFKGKNKWADSILKYFHTAGKIIIQDERVALSAFKKSYTEEQKKIKGQVEETYYQGGWMVPFITDVAKSFQDPQEVMQIIQDLVKEGILIKIDSNIYLHRFFYEKALSEIKSFIRENESITLGQFRDLLETSRKYALPLLEYFDEQKITIKKEDWRVLFTN
ncbi:MAG: selenocysteine-specific translation elongation factor [Peptostreptococcales bacterium]